MKIALAALATLTLAGCAGPQTTLVHPETKQAVTCTGSASSLAFGGIVGAAQSHDECVAAHKQIGFVAVELPPGPDYQNPF